MNYWIHADIETALSPKKAVLPADQTMLVVLQEVLVALVALVVPVDITDRLHHG